MAKNKLIAIAASIASIAMVIPAFSLSASAKCGDQIQVGGQNVKLYTDLEDFDDGYMCGKNATKADWYADPFYSCYNGTSCIADGKNYGLNMHIAAGIGVDKSKGVAFADTSAVAKTGINDGVQFQADKVAGGVTDFRGATDAIFWVDCTQNANKKVDINCVWTEYDYNPDGTPYMAPNDKNVMTQQLTSWGIYPSKKNVYYTLQDGTSDWQTVTGVPGNCVEVSNTFKGYIRVPLVDFVEFWDSDDIDGQQNLAHISRFGVFTGMMPADAGKSYVMAADNFGFVGNFKDVKPMTTNTALDTTTAAIATDASGANNDNGTTAANSSSSTTSSNPSTGEAPIAAAVVTSIVFAAVLAISKKKADR